MPCEGVRLVISKPPICSKNENVYTLNYFCGEFDRVGLRSRS